MSLASFSAAGIAIIKSALTIESGTLNSIKYEILLDLTSVPSSLDSNIGSMKLKFSNPIEFFDAKRYADNILEMIDRENSSNIADSILNQLGNLIYSPNNKLDVLVSSASGMLKIPMLNGGGLSSEILDPYGRPISAINLKALLEQLTKKYLKQYMQSPLSHLRYRTGRFVESVKVPEVELSQNIDNQIDISYMYQTYPYSVFNPVVSTYNRLSLTPFRGARDPTRLISDAITKAAKELINARYRLVIKEEP